MIVSGRDFVLLPEGRSTEGFGLVVAFQDKNRHSDIDSDKPDKLINDTCPQPFLET
jgi:hypothetical protein